MKAKKLQVILLCCFAFVCFFIMSGNVKAAEVDSGECGEGVFWSYDDNGTLTISGEGEMDDYTDDVYGEGIYTPWYDYKEKITTVIINEGITRIGECAFAVCPILTEVDLPNSLEEIGISAFEECYKLEKIQLPEKVFIDYYAFDYCGLTEIYIPKDVTMMWPVFPSNCLKYIEVSPENKDFMSEDGVLYDKNKETLLCYPSYKEDIFYSIPDSVTKIDSFAFDGNQYLQNIKITDKVTWIGQAAFSGCNFESIVIPESVTYFEGDGYYFFGGNTKLKEVNLPNSIIKIGQYMFVNCNNLECIIIPDGVTSIGAGAFSGCTNLKKLVIPSSVTEIERNQNYEDVFQSCDNLTIYGYIGSYAETYAKENNIPFVSLDGTADGGDVGNDNLKPEIPSENPSAQQPAPSTENPITPVNESALAVGKCVTDVADNAVYRITGNTDNNRTVEYIKPLAQKTKVTIPPAVVIQGKNYQVTAIANKAFKNNKKVKKIVIPSTVKKIGKQAFFNCKKLKNIVIKTKKLKNNSVGKKAFKGISAKTVIKVPKAKRTAYKKMLRKKGVSKYLQIK